MKKLLWGVRRNFYLLLLCAVLAGCGGNAAQEQGAASSGDSPAAIPVYSEQDDKAAADYLRSQYGILSDGNVPKVILDTDMAYFGDDAMCLSILVQADELGLIELLGVTVTGGNTFVAAGTNSTLTQLERIGREDIPVYMGTDEPVGGFRDLQEQEKIVGSIDHWGAQYNFDRYIEPDKYHDLGADYDRDWGYSHTEPQTQNSVDFMIEQAAKYPGEVTILSVGAATNIALACEQEPSFASDTAGIIYMGTIVDGPGTYTPYADFNVFYDAEAFSVCLKSDFPTQIIVPHNAAESAVLNKTVFDLLDAKGDTLISRMWVDGQYSQYRRTPTRKMNCTDAIAAVVLLNPDVVKTKEDLYVQINTDVNAAEYGQTTTREKAGADSGAVQATFILEVDTGAFWDFATDLLCHVQEETEYTYEGFLELL
ncbi:MAG: nucleoside hydrolase [Ruminococcus sp.]|nr:nucleoside hydrolase [Ruminococcus sp.]